MAKDMKQQGQKKLVPPTMGQRPKKPEPKGGKAQPPSLGNTMDAIRRRKKMLDDL